MGSDVTRVKWNLGIPIERMDLHALWCTQEDKTYVQLLREIYGTWSYRWRHHSDGRREEAKISGMFCCEQVRGCKYNHHIYELGGGTLKSTKTEGEAGTTRSHICNDVMHEACTYMLDRAVIRRNRMCRTLISASYSCFPIPSSL